MNLGRTISSFDSECIRLEKAWENAGLHRAFQLDEACFLAGAVESVWARRVPGKIVECGSYTGFSTCALSIACDELHRRLVPCDSFRGLPIVGKHHEYKDGDWACSRQQWEYNVKQCGRWGAIDSAAIREGDFMDTLTDWDEPIALLFMDVDLGKSVDAVLGLLLPHLSKGGLILSHETQLDYIDGNGQIDRRRANEVWLAIARHIGGRPYRAYHLGGFLAEVEFKE